MVIIAFDPNAENVVRQAYVVPKGVTVHAAVVAVKRAYKKARDSGDDPIEALEKKGYTLADWMGAEVEDN